MEETEEFCFRECEHKTSLLKWRCVLVRSWLACSNKDLKKLFNSKYISPLISNTQLPLFLFALWSYGGAEPIIKSLLNGMYTLVNAYPHEYTNVKVKETGVYIYMYIYIHTCIDMKYKLIVLACGKFQRI